ncbi:MAG: alpha-amylase family glycosyl hydrolase, partial [bacterium]|nr:alpha-amylase family glycosyl hydrolase [bacterium]
DSQGYHGYWPIDFFQTDEHVGSMEKFTELIDKAHEKGMKIVLDIPLNHTAWEHPFYKDPEKKESWYHNIGDIQNFDDPYQAENGSMFGLPDLAQENPEVYSYLTDVAKFWVDKGIDGFRLDAVKNVPVSFWDKFTKEMHSYAGDDFFMVGECFDGNPAKLNNYQAASMDSLFDYPLHFTMVETFAKDGSMRELANKLTECANKYEHPEMMSVFLDNHDTNRFLSVAGGDKDPEMLDFFKKLTSIRQENPALRQGDMNEMWQDDKVFAFSRKCDEQEAIVVLNNAGNNEYREIPIRPESGIKDGTVMKDLMTGQTVTVKGGKICANIAGKNAGIFVPQN